MFADLIAQWGGPAAFTRALGNKHLHGKVSVEAAQQLVSWSDLDEVIINQRLAPPDLFLADNGQVIPPTRYLDSGPSPLRKNHPMVDPAKLRKCLTAGATLVINNLHEMLPKVIDGAHELGRAVGERIQGNLYATWGKTHGFKPHWDDHDVLIVQIQGSKKWDIYGPGKPWPLDHTDDADNTRPSAPVWSGTLTPGDVLYLPRGWWHNVGGTGNATVHLTFGFQRRTAMNYITWLIDKLPENEIFRMDLPRDQVEQHQNAISEAIGSALNEHSMKEYLSEFSCQLDREAPSPLTLESVRAEQNVTIDPC